MQLIKGCGMALVVAGSLMAAATVLHPSRETAETIIASEGRLVASHVLHTVSWLLVLLGLPGLHAAARGTMQRLGLVGFLVAFLGTYLIAVTGSFGFLAPVLARESPAVLDSITQYPPEVGRQRPSGRPDVQAQQSRARHLPGRDGRRHHRLASATRLVRNGLSHGTRSWRPSLLEPAAELLEVIARAHLMRTIGVNETSIEHYMSKSA
jgi:hypothetical protein